MWPTPMMYNNGLNPPLFNQPQTIQQLTTPTAQKQASCFFVKGAEELAGINIMPNTYYLGINREKSEVYIRRMNNDGNIEAEVYTKASEKKEKTDLQAVLERLTNIEKILTPKAEANNVAVPNVDHE